MSNQILLPAILLIICSCFIGCKKESNSPPTDEEILGNVVKPEIIDEYIYPVKPDTPEWAALGSHDEMVDVLQLPDPALQKISTWGLAQTCFKYPLWSDYSVQNNEALYINNLSKSFNGLKELFSREDAPIVLLYEYRHLDFSKYSNPFEISFIELMIGSDSVIARFTHRQQLYIVSVAIEKANEHRKYFNCSIAPNSYYMMANVMTHAGYKPFISYCESTNDAFLGEYVLFWGLGAPYDKIEEYAKEFVKN